MRRPGRVDGVIRAVRLSCVAHGVRMSDVREAKRGGTWAARADEAA